jgi:hypothetical protein
MPKELHEISKFMAGTVTVPTETDISDDTASYSLNIDPVAEDGILKGIPNDTMQAGYSVNTVTAGGWSITDVLVRTTNEYTGTNGAVYTIVITDVGGSPNKFQWRVNGAGGADNVNCDTGWITLSNGVQIKFSAVSGFDVSMGMQFTAGMRADRMARLNLAGKSSVVFFDDGDDKIKKISNLHSTPVVATLSTAAEDVTGIPTMQVNNKEAHIGMGNGEDDKPLWCGEISHSQLGTSVSGLQLEDAKLLTGNLFPELYKTVSDSTYIYGIQWQGTRVYKFQISDGTFVDKSVKAFISTQGLALDSAGKVWVYDRDDATHGSLYKCIPATITVDFKCGLSASSASISDMMIVTESSTSLIWLSAHGTYGPGGQAACLFQGTLPTSSSTVTFTQRGPFLGERGSNTSQSADVGNFVNRTKAKSYGTTGFPNTDDQGATVKCRIPKVALFATDNGTAGYGNWVGLIVYFFNSTVDLYDGSDHGRYGTISSRTGLEAGKDQGDALVTSSATTNKLVDTSAYWTSTPYASYYRMNLSATTEAGGRPFVTNVTDGTRAQVTDIDSATVLSISADIMGSGDEYIIEGNPMLYYHRFTDIDGSHNLYKPVAWAFVLIKNDYAGAAYTQASATVFSLSDGNNAIDEKMSPEFTYGGVNLSGIVGHADYFHSLQTEHTNNHIFISFNDTPTGNAKIWVFPSVAHDRVFGQYHGSGGSTQAENQVEARNTGGTQYVEDLGMKKCPIAVVLTVNGASDVYINFFSGGEEEKGLWKRTDYNTDSPDFSTPATILETVIDLDITENNEASGVFTATTKYFWKTSLTYDEYQESPLGDSFTNTNAASKNYDIVITLTNPTTTWSKRVSHLNLYRADGGSGVAPTGFYRLVKSIKLDADWAASGNNFTYHYTDEGTALASYEALNGISEVIDDTLPNYSLSTQLNNHHYIANCFHADIDEATNYLFKSLPYNFNQFDWTLDLLRLPTVPTALAAFQGRVYAFGENNTYRIEPNSLYIEDTFEGVGCIGPDAVVVTEYGMCFADKNNIYLHDGRQPVPIGNSILSGDDKSWQNRDTAWASKIIFDAERNSFVVLFKYLTNYYAWVFNIARRRWDLWEVFGTTEPLSVLNGKNGEMFLNNGSSLMHYLGHASTKRNWDWHSKKLTMGANTQTKVFKRTRIAGSTSARIDTFVSSEGTPTNSGAADGVLDYVYKLSGAASRAKWLQYKISSEANTVDAIGTIFRRRPVK